MDGGDPILVANAIEAAAMLAADAGAPVAASMELHFSFDAEGNCTVTCGDAEPVKVSAADIAAKADVEEDREMSAEVPA